MHYSGLFMFSSLVLFSYLVALTSVEAKPSCEAVCEVENSEFSVFVNKRTFTLSKKVPMQDQEDEDDDAGAERQGQGKGKGKGGEQAEGKGKADVGDKAKPRQKNAGKGFCRGRPKGNRLGRPSTVSFLNLKITSTEENKPSIVMKIKEDREDVQCGVKATDFLDDSGALVDATMYRLVYPIESGNGGTADLTIVIYVLNENATIGGAQRYVSNIKWTALVDNIQCDGSACTNYTDMTFSVLQDLGNKDKKECKSGCGRQRKNSDGSAVAFPEKATVDNAEVDLTIKFSGNKYEMMTKFGSKAVFDPHVASSNIAADDSDFYDEVIAGIFELETDSSANINKNVPVATMSVILCAWILKCLLN